MLGKYRQFKEQLANLWSYYKLFSKIYDYSSLLLVERNQIKRLRKRIANHQLSVSREITIQKIDLAISLLDIILEETDIIELVNKDEPPFDDKGDFTVGKWRLLKYVNTKNAKRFVSEHRAKLADEGEEIFIEDLYREKAWKLYYRLREQYTRAWF